MALAVTLAAGQYPLLDLFWTTLLLLGLAVWLWAIVVVFRDLFTRDDIGAGRKTLWVVAVLVFPIISALVYLGTRSDAMGERRLQSRGDSYRGVRDVTRTTQAWSGPIRPA